MSTEDLIQRLAQSPAPQARFGVTLAAAGTAGLAVATIAFLLSAGVRADLFSAWASTLLKASYGLAAALALAPLVWRAARPNVRLRDAAIPAAVVVALALAIAAASLIATPAELRWLLWTSGGVPDCLIRIPLIAIPIAASLFYVARRFAPTRLALAGAALGAGAGALAAMPYSLFCPIDSPSYVTTWYTVSILICGGLGFAAGRFLRW